MNMKARKLIKKAAKPAPQQAAEAIVKQILAFKPEEQNEIVNAVTGAIIMKRKGLLMDAKQKLIDLEKSANVLHEILTR